MPVFHSTRKEATAWSPARQRLEQSLAKVRSRPPVTVDFEPFEREIHARFNEAEREVLSEELERLDSDRPWVKIGGRSITGSGGETGPTPVRPVR